MATTAAAAKAPIEAPAAESGKKKSKLLPIVAIVLVLSIAGGAGAWWFLGRDAAEQDEAAEIASKPAIFVPLEQFTVNLQAEEGQQFLQTAMTLKVTDPDVAEAIKTQMPEVRSRVLFLLSSKKPSQLSSLEGKNKLIAELIQEVEATLPALKPKKAKKRAGDEDDAPKAKKGKGKAKAKAEAEPQQDASPPRVHAVYFTHFIVQ
jgi:flagellar FliL protein